MLESSEWPAVGVLAGVTDHFGHYYECLNIKGPEFKGKYCLPQAEISFSVKDDDCLATRKNSYKVPPECPAWNFVEMVKF